MNTKLILLFFSFLFPPLRGSVLTLAQLETIKKRTPPSSAARLVEKCTTIPSKTSALPSYDEVFWWQIFPTTGMRLEAPFWPLTYPYLPHAFPLWEMAPSLGKGVIVTIIDTGVAAFTCTSQGASYTQHPDLTVAGDFTRECYNFLPHEKRQSDPFGNLTDLLASAVKDAPLSDIQKTLSACIREYLLAKSTSYLDYYLKKHGKDFLFKKRHIFLLTPQGNRFYKSLLHGSCGFSTFHLTRLSAPYNQLHALQECIPLPDANYVHNNPHALPSGFALDHGTHIASIIGARLSHPLPSCQPINASSVKRLLKDDKGLCGLAPQCTLYMIKALRTGGVSVDISSIIKALHRAQKHRTDVINLSFACDNQFGPHHPLFVPFEKALACIPYVCASIGNTYQTKQVTFSYPAHCKNISFNVGSFEYSARPSLSCPISSFSLYEPRYAPHYVAPGKQIVGCSYIPHQKGPFYALRSGTSHATSLMTGFVALLLGEFQHDFTQEQILCVCQHSCLRLHATSSWKTHVQSGVLDMRTALFTLHVLRNLQKFPLFSKDFPHLVNTIHSVIFSMADTYGRTCGTTHNFKESFVDYFNTVRTQAPSSLIHTTPFLSFKDAVVFVQKAALEKMKSDAPIQ